MELEVEEGEEDEEGEEEEKEEEREEKEVELEVEEGEEDEEGEEEEEEEKEEEREEEEEGGRSNIEHLKNPGQKIDLGMRASQLSKLQTCLCSQPLTPFSTDIWERPILQPVSYSFTLSETKIVGKIRQGSFPETCTALMGVHYIRKNQLSLHPKPAEAPNGSSESQHAADNHGFFKAPVVVTHAAPCPSAVVKDLHCALVIVRTDTAIDKETNWVLKAGGGNCVCVCGEGEGGRGQIITTDSLE